MTSDAATAPLDPDVGSAGAPTTFQRFVGGPLNSNDLAACIVRIVFGVVVLGQGMSKLVSWSILGHTSSTREYADGIITFFGYDHTYFLSCILTATEVTAGALLILGLLTPLGAAAVIGISFQFVSVQWPDGLFGHDELPGFYVQLWMLAVGVAIAYHGPGHLALDRALGLKLSGLRWGTYTIVLGLAVGMLVMAIFGPGLFTAPPNH